MRKIAIGKQFLAAAVEQRSETETDRAKKRE